MLTAVPAQRTPLSIAPLARDPSALMRLVPSLAAGVGAAVLALILGGGRLAPVIGWDGGAVVYLAWMWSTIWRLDSGATARRAAREDPRKVMADALLLSASVVSLVAVGIVLVEAGNRQGATKDVLVALAIFSVVIAWGVIHTVFTLRYAGLYYSGSGQSGGVDFNEHEAPRYSDFAYLAFTIGMTFQVSDTDLKTKDIRATALRHALLSYLFGAVIIASTINLIAGLTK